jgi:hypothetical protein
MNTTNNDACREAFERWVDSNGYDDDHHEMFWEVWQAALASVQQPTFEGGHKTAAEAHYYGQIEALQKEVGRLKEDLTDAHEMRREAEHQIELARAKAISDALGCYSPDDTASDWADKIRSLSSQQLTQAQAAKVPDGYVLVPKEPTEEMLNADVPLGANGQYRKLLWDVMLSAAPVPSTVAQVPSIVLLKQAKSIIQRWCELYTVDSRGGWLPPARISEWMEDFDVLMLAIAEQPETMK